MILVDANVLLYAQDASSEHHDTAPSEAVAIISSLLAQPSVAIVSPSEDHWAILSSLLPAQQARGALVMDAHLAALAREHGMSICTTDRDFARFPDLRIVDPLSG